MTLLEQIKKSMRIAHTALDDTIKADVEAGKIDLSVAGVQPLDTDGNLKDDALINKALELYCKSQADYEGKGIQYQEAYDKLKDSLSLCGDYKRDSDER